MNMNMNTTIHAPTRGMYCVPTAIELITGADPESVIFPALNRAAREGGLLDAPAGVRICDARRALEEMGWNVREFKDGKRPLKVLLSAWATRFPDRTMLVTAGAKHERHALVLWDGKAYDSWEPHGVPAALHPFHNSKVRWAAWVHK